MWKIGILWLTLLVAGCATSPGTGLIPPMPEELKRSSKDIDSAFQEWMAPYLKTEDNRRLNKPDTEYIPIDDRQLKEKRQSLFDAVDLTAKALIVDLMDYCVGHGGTRTMAICSPNPNLYTQCEDGKKNRVSTPSMFGPDSVFYEGASLYFTCRKGDEIQLEVGVGRGTFQYGRTVHKLFVLADSPQRRAKYRAIGTNDLDEYHLLKNPSVLEHRRLEGLIYRFEKKDDPENLLPLAKARLDELTQAKVVADKAAAIAKTAATEKAAQLKRQDFLTTVNTGSLVCRTIQASVDNPTGTTVMGRAQTVTVQGKAQIAGYVNQRANQKLQIQVSAIHFRWIDESYRSHEQELDSLDRFQGSAALRVNGVVWDSEKNWEFCNN